MKEGGRDGLFSPPQRYGAPRLTHRLLRARMRRTRLKTGRAAVKTCVSYQMRTVPVYRSLASLAASYERVTLRRHTASLVRDSF